MGIGADTAAETLTVFGDNPDRIRSEAASAKLCGACPIPATSAATNRHRLSRAAHRHANAAHCRAVIVRMRFHQPTIDHTRRRTTEGLSKRDIIRRLKRFPAQEIHQRDMTDHRARLAHQQAKQTKSRPIGSRTNKVLTYRGVNALAEAVNALFKTELIRGTRQGPWRTVDDVELATLGWAHWWNTRRIHSYLDDLSPDRFEAAYVASNTDQTDTSNHNIQPAQNPG